MSLFVLDDQLDASAVLPIIQKWAKVTRLRDLRIGQQVLDDRVPSILLAINKPTFLTIDQGFWSRRWCNPNYCVLYFALRSDQQAHIPDLLRKLMRLPGFQTRSRRMGKVARVGLESVEYWQWQAMDPQRIPWRAGRKSN
jgi:hypothetical protein